MTRQGTVTEPLPPRPSRAFGRRLSHQHNPSGPSTGTRGWRSRRRQMGQRLVSWGAPRVLERVYLRYGGFQRFSFRSFGIAIWPPAGHVPTMYNSSSDHLDLARPFDPIISPDLSTFSPSHPHSRVRSTTASQIRPSTTGHRAMDDPIQERPRSVSESDPLLGSERRAKKPFYRPRPLW